jgi:putative ABC transport system substrate-binding protein
MRRREFLGLIAGAAVGGSPAARAQQAERVRHIGVLNSLASNDSEGQTRIAAFMQGLQQAGWTVGRNLQIDFRWAAGRVDDHRKIASELIALKPEVILATGSAATAPLHAASTVPVVFVNVIDPVGAGFVESLARPGGNVTGFTQFEYSTSGKWLELLKEIAPRVTRAAVLRFRTAWRARPVCRYPIGGTRAWHGGKAHRCEHSRQDRARTRSLCGNAK